MTRLGAVTGLAYEAGCLRRAFGTTPIAVEMTGGRTERVVAAVDRLLERGAPALLSYGLAGGLDPALAPGRIVIAENVAFPGGRVLATDRDWTAALRHAAGPDGATFGTVAGTDLPVTTLADKEAMRRRTQALAVDMESHAVALAAAGRASLAVVRVIVDPAGRVVPHAALVSLREDGGIDLPALLKSLLCRPGQLPAMIALARDAAAARGGLRQAAIIAAAADPPPLRPGDRSAREV